MGSFYGNSASVTKRQVRGWAEEIVRWASDRTRPLNSGTIDCVSFFFLRTLLACIACVNYVFCCFQILPVIENVRTILSTGGAGFFKDGCFAPAGMFFLSRKDCPGVLTLWDRSRTARPVPIPEPLSLLGRGIGSESRVSVARI